MEDNSQPNIPISADRDWQEITDDYKIQEFIVEKFSKNISTVKGFEESKPRAKFVSKKPDFMYVLKLDTELEFPEKKGTIYSNFERHIELDFDIIQSKSDMLLIKPTLLKLAEFERKSKRITDIRGKVSATNFLISKDNIDENQLFGVASTVLIQDIHKKLVPLSLNSEVIMPKDKKFSEEIDLAFNYEKMIYILDTVRMVSLNDERVLDAKKEFENELILEEKLDEYNKKKISSLVIYPVSIPFGSRKPFAFLVAQKDSGGIETGILDLYKKVEEVFLERIMDSNTHTVDIRQNVINASIHGLALEITDDRIRKSLKVKPSFTIDLNFKMQQPLRVALEVKHTKDCGSYDLVGTEIIGFSGDVEGGKKYASFLDFIQKI